MFGKVASVVEDNVLMFARNKLLRNLSADALDEVIGAMHQSISSGESLAGMSPDSFLKLKLKLDSRVRVKSLRVLTLAIFS